MRRIALALALIVTALSLLASGVATTTVKVYFTVGPAGVMAGQQLWRCNRDGSDAELLVNGTRLSGVAVDSANERLFFVDCGSGGLVVADLDGANPAYFGSSPSLLEVCNGWGLGPVVVSGGFVCWQLSDGPYVASSATDGSDFQYFECSGFPEMVPSPVILGVGLYVHDDNPVESTSWGRIKSRFRR